MEMSHRPWQSHHTGPNERAKRWRFFPQRHPVNSSPDRKCGEDFAPRRLRSLCSNSSWTELVHPIACRISAR